MGLFGKKTEEKKVETPVEKKPVVKAEKKPIAPKGEKPVQKEKGETLFVKEKHVLVRPLITEKVTDLATKDQYVFAVHPDVNKIEIKNEIKKTYNVEPIKVNVVTVKGKRVRYGRTTGKKKNWKKAIVFLKKGDKIEVSKAK